MEWQDISTAPRDGTPVLICRAGQKYPLMGQWQNEIEVKDDGTVSGWLIHECEDYWYTWALYQENEMPAHWMPLPEPPK